MNQLLLPAIIATLMTAAVLAAIFGKRLGRNVGYGLSAIYLTLFVLVMLQGPTVVRKEPLEFSVPWIPSMGVDFSLRLNGLALLFSVVVLGVGALILSYAARYFSTKDPHGRLYGILVFFTSGMMLLVLGNDLLVMFLGWEITTVCSFLLVAGNGTFGAKPATRAFVVTGASGIALLGGFAMLAVVAGTTNVTEIVTNPQLVMSSPLYPVIGLLIAVAAMTKSAQMPLHFWLPGAMVASTPVSAYLHAATLVKGGVFVLLVFNPLFTDWLPWHIMLVVVGLTTALIAALFALQKHDLKAILAYSTVSQLGFIIALVGVGTTLALAGAVLFTFAHALFKATLFMLVGIVDHKTGTRDIRDLSGLWRVMPATAVVTAMAALSMAGVAPFVGFVAKEEAFAAFLDAPNALWLPDRWPWLGWTIALIAVLAACLTFAYSMRILVGAFGGRDVEHKLTSPSVLFWAPAGIAAGLGLILGIAPWVLNGVLSRAVTESTLQDKQAKLSIWHGFTPALGLSVTVVVVGSLLFWQRERVDRSLQQVRLPCTGAELYDRWYAAVLRFGAWTAKPAHLRKPPAYLLPSFLLLVLLLLATAAVSGLSWQTHDFQAWGDVALLVALAVSLAVLLFVPRVVGALVALGAIGLLIAALFIRLGGVDLALTQVLVEILTVVVMAFVLLAAPSTFRPLPKSRHLRAAAIAIPVGVASAFGVLLFNGGRDRSELSNRLLAEGQSLSGGSNVVNTVLVDFRGLDTLGEVSVLAVVGLGLLMLRNSGLGAAKATTGVGNLPLPTAIADRLGPTQYMLRASFSVLLPVLGLLALLLLYQGHNAPGGGFIGGLVAGAAVVVGYLAGIRIPAWLAQGYLIVWGMFITVASGLLGLATGSYLSPILGEISIGGLVWKYTSSLVFDLGVFMVVLGLVATAITQLGSEAGQMPRVQLPTEPADTGSLANPATSADRSGT